LYGLIAVVITLLILSVIVVIHEWGHFIAARFFKVKVEEFSVGMGPLLYGREHNGIMYSIRWLLIGGYCKMTDDIEDGDGSEFGYNDISLVKRCVISFAGPFMNFVLSLILMVVLAMCTGIFTTDVVSVVDGGGAQRAGIEVGDRITSFNGSSVHTRDTLDYYMTRNGTESVKLGIKRGSESLILRVTPTLDEDSGRYLLGVGLDVKAPAINVLGREWASSTDKGSLIEYAVYGFWSMVSYVKLTFFSFGDIVRGEIGISELSGPVGMVGLVDTVVTETAKISYASTLITLIEFAGLISISLGIINLFPIPALDGGRIIIYIFELIFRREMPRKIEGAIHAAGFILLMGLGLYIAYMDVTKML
jgi:regulator of sigma E protease